MKRIAIFLGVSTIVTAGFWLAGFDFDRRGFGLFLWIYGCCTLGGMSAWIFGDAK